jgi:hypothetical protein
MVPNASAYMSAASPLVKIASLCTTTAATSMVKIAGSAANRVPRPSAINAGHTSSPKIASAMLTLGLTPSGSENVMCFSGNFISLGQPWFTIMNDDTPRRSSSAAPSRP